MEVSDELLCVEPQRGEVITRDWVSFREQKGALGSEATMCENVLARLLISTW